jgi:hypothetical protein
VCRELAGAAPALLGWWSTAEEQKSLRFVFAATAPSLQLDRGWPNRGQSNDIGGYDLDAMSPRPIALERDFDLTAPFDFLTDLLTLGSQSLASRLRGVESSEQVPLAPGLIGYDNRSWLCRKLRYDFSIKGMPATLAPVSGSTRQDHVTVTVTLAQHRPPPSSAPGVNLAEGEVQGWSQDRRWLGLVPVPGADWKMAVLDNGQDKPAPALWCAAHSLTGYAPGRGHSGVYVRHLAGDQLVALVAGNEPPRTLGGRQTLIQDLDRAEIDLGLAAQSVAILTGGSKVSPEQGSGIRMAGPDGVVTGQNLKIFEKTLSISSGTVDAEAKMTIKGSLDVSK